MKEVARYRCGAVLRGHQSWRQSTLGRLCGMEEELEAQVIRCAGLEGDGPIGVECGVDVDKIAEVDRRLRAAEGK